MSESIKNPTLIDPEMKEIVESFIVESKEILDKLDVDLIDLEKRPNDSELLNQIFRSFHTVKGTSGFLGLEKLPHVTHQCEDILNKLRKGEAVLNEDLMDGIILGYDTMKDLVNAIESSQNEDVDTDKVSTVLENLIASLENGGQKSAAAIKEKETGPSKSIEKDKIEIINTETPENKEESKFVSNSNSDENDNSETIVQLDEVKNTKTESSSKNNFTQLQKDNTIRVDVARLDALLDIVSELVLGRNRLFEVSTKFSIEDEGINIPKILAK